MRKIDLGTLGFTAAMLVTATPAMAGLPVSPAPVVGMGVVGVAVLAAGYRVLRNRFK